jgi:hypothetical protein
MVSQSRIFYNGNRVFHGLKGRGQQCTHAHNLRLNCLDGLDKLFCRHVNAQVMNFKTIDIQ